MDLYHEKYLKYKIKYLILKKNLDNVNEFESSEDLINQEGGNSKPHKKYLCNPNKQTYKEICIIKPNGNYESKEICEDNCDQKFITVQLRKSNIYKETMQFYYFINDLIKQEQIKIYIKGGNVIGLAVLKLIYNKYSNDNEKFKKVFLNFLKLELIKDWDFSGYTKENVEIDDKYKNKLNKLAKTHKLEPRAKTFILYQAKHPILIYEKALFEIAISDLDSSDFSKMEIPLSTMKIHINEKNIYYIFMLVKSFYSWIEKKTQIDLDIIKKIIGNIDIIIHPHKSGFYDPKNGLDVGELNKELVEFIYKFTKNNIYHAQFLITQLEDPYRLIYRMPEKNIKKTEQIIEFIQTNIKDLTPPNWLINPEIALNLLNKFINEIGIKLSQIYKQTNSLDKVLDFLDGVNFGKPQIQIEWEEFNSKTKLRLKNIFKPLIEQIGLTEFKNIIKLYKIDEKAKTSELNNSEKIIKLFRFLIKKKFF